MPNNDDTQSLRQRILAELSTLDSIARGTLTEEFRTPRSSDSSDPKRLGPYYKHQFWQFGRNCSSRVPAAAAEQLREDLKNGQRFDQLTAELESLAIAEGDARREALAASASPADCGAGAKKNSKKIASKSDTKKPRHSSP